MEPNALVVAATKQGKTEMKFFYSEMCDMDKTTSV
jgi:hypothetical protein